MEEPQILSIPIEDIKIDPSMDPRFGEERDPELVASYAEVLDDLPPIVIDQDNHILDGVHRYEAHLLAGRDTIEVKRHRMEHKGEAFILSVQANATFGKALTTKNRRDAARYLYDRWGYSDKVIAKAVGGERKKGTVHTWLEDLKREWKAYVREKAYRMYEGTDEYVPNKKRKRKWTHEKIAKHLSGPREKAIGTRTLRNHIEYRRDQLKAEKERLEEEARAAEEHAQAEQSDEVDVAADAATVPPKETDTADIATDTDTEPPQASESYEESHYSEAESIDEPADHAEDIPAHPTADEVEGDGQKEAKTADDFIDVINQANELADNAERDKHTESQYMLLWLGEKMGLDLWIANNDGSKKYNGKELSSLFKTSPLPVRKYGEAQETIEYTDVMWMKNDNIIAAFEVEESTGVYSGLLRLSDLKIVLSEPELYIVSKKYSFRKVKREINRPSFKKIGLSEHCRYISYALLVGKYNEVEQSSSLPDDWRQLLEDIAQKL